MDQCYTYTLVLLQVVEIKPEWPKGYSRLGAAAIGMGDTERAKAAYEKGMLCPEHKNCMQRLSGPSQGIMALDWADCWRPCLPPDWVGTVQHTLVHRAAEK